MARPAIFSPGGGVGGGVGGGLFVDHKKGEIPELKNLLRDSAVDKNPKQKRAVMERVVGYMTLGIDMSPLFSEMIMATATKDLVQKKMCYLYLTNYASQQAEMALLVINTLQKDARDQDPMVRGLALRCFVPYMLLCARRRLGPGRSWRAAWDGTGDTQPATGSDVDFWAPASRER